MANGEALDCAAAIKALGEEIDSLRQEQIAAQASAALAGMTLEEARGYKQRHRRIRKLMEELAGLVANNNGQSIG